MPQPVAPLAGAWIETELADVQPDKPWVAPLAGAWIETFPLVSLAAIFWVAPLAGAWIETPTGRQGNGLPWSRTPRGCVD